eukprot:gene53042-56252_t
MLRFDMARVAVGDPAAPAAVAVAAVDAARRPCVARLTLLVVLPQGSAAPPGLGSAADT